MPSLFLNMSFIFSGYDEIMYDQIDAFLTHAFVETCYIILNQFIQYQDSRSVYKTGYPKGIPVGQFSLPPPDHYKFFIDLSGHVADLARVFTRDPSLIWNSELSSI